MSSDLPKHAADKVKRAMDDVYQLTSDPGEMLKIALFASGICIGQAAGILAGMVQTEGGTVSSTAAKQEILRLLTIMVTDGPDAVLQALRSVD